MTYEAAPATALLATHCAVCNRPLRDATSVERGVGPECAEKYGYFDASQPANTEELVRVHEALAAIDADMATAVFADNDAHGIANRAVHHAAALAHCDAMEDGRVTRIELLVAAMRAAGYARMADAVQARIAEYIEARAEYARELEAQAARAAQEALLRAPTLVIAAEGDRLAITFRNLTDDQFKSLLGVLRGVPSRRFDVARKRNLIAANDRRQVWDALTTRPVFDGLWIESTKGRSQVRAQA